MGLYRQRIMSLHEIDRFVRLPTELLEALLQVPLSGAQWRILFWVIRQTYGWNRNRTPFSWYRIAKELALDRGGVSRAGHKLLRKKFLSLEDNRLRVERDTTRWQTSRLPPRRGEASLVAMTDVDADKRHRKAMSGIIGSDDNDHLKRCPESSLFRRAKDSSKDKSKIYKDKPLQKYDDARHRLSATSNNKRPPLAGAAAPVPGKYDSISNN
jgi:phage replication O-like protein O